MNSKLIFPIFILLIFTSNLSAQCINGTKSYPIYKMGAQLVQEFDSRGDEIVRIEYDLVFTSKETYRNLTSDWEYSIVGFADNGVKDLDVKIYEYDQLLDSWTLMAKDDTSEAYAVVSFRPPTTAMYKVEVIVYSFYPGYSAAKYGLMFVHD